MDDNDSHVPVIDEEEEEFDRQAAERWEGEGGAFLPDNTGPLDSTKQQSPEYLTRDQISPRKEAEVRDFAKLILHLVLVALVLIVWIVMAWAVDRIAIAALPASHMETISFRIMEIVLHLSTLKLLYNTLFR